MTVSTGNQQTGTFSFHKECNVGCFFRLFEIILFCFVVAIFNLVHDVEAIFGLLLTVSGDNF